MKKNRIYCLLVTLLLLVGQLSAQNSIRDFSSLKSQGPMPADLKNITIQSIEWMDYGTFLKELVMDGRILYGTPLNDYVNTVADNLLKDDPELKSKIHIYIVNSPIVNAYTTYNGLVFVTLGILAQVSNESELAFILAHEFAHVAEYHLVKYSSSKEKIGNQDPLNYYVNMQSTSRNKEFAADRIALERFIARTSYSYEVMDDLYDVLQYADLPFDEVPFSKSLVETDFYQFPDNYFLTNVAPISSRADAVDTLSTHPNVEKRRAAAADVIASLSNNGRSVFVQPESLFYEIRNLARFECINYFLTEHQYDQAFYNTYVLLKSFPDNKFLNAALAASVYGFSKHKNYGSASDVIASHKDLEGEMQQTSYFLSKLTRQEASLLAVRFAWKARENDPDNAYLTRILKDALKDVFVKNKMKYQDFSDFPMGSHPDSSLVAQPQPADMSGSRYDRIRQQNKALIFPTEKFKTANYMLVDIHQNETFNKMMTAVINQAEDDQVMDIVTQREPANVKAMMIFTPAYEIPDKVKQSNKGSLRLQKNLKTCLHRLKISDVAYTAKDVRDFTTDQFNGYAELQHWKRDYQQTGGVEMVHYTGQDMKLAADLTHTSAVVITAVERTKEHSLSLDKSNAMAGAVLCPYVLPMSITLLALPHYKTEMYILVTDFQTGETLHAARGLYSSVMSDAYLNSFMYDQLYHFVKGK